MRPGCSRESDNTEHEPIPEYIQLSVSIDVKENSLQLFVYILEHEPFPR